MNKLLTQWMINHPIKYALAFSLLTAGNTALLLHYLNL